MPDPGDHRPGSSPADEVGAERNRIARVYQAYDDAGRQGRWDALQPGNRAMLAERDATLHALLAAGRPPRTVLDVGGGNGDALATFLAAGPAPIDAARAVGVDLIGDRLAAAATAYGARFARADATALPFPDATFDLVLCFTVLSSVGDLGVRQAIADDITRVLTPGGALGWYDMRRPSPTNPDVSPIDAVALRGLFPGLRGEVRPVTLLPPLARRLGRATAVAYGPLARVPLLRTHLAAVLRKP